MSEPRRFNEREVAEIVRLATEGRAAPATADGMTLAEIQAVVGELGLDSTAVAEAADQVQAGLPETHVSGGQVEFLRTYDGELDDAGWEEIILLLRRRTGSTGEVSVRGSTREWSAGKADIEQNHFSATVKNGRTRVRLSQDGTGMTVLIWIMTALPILMGPAIILSKSSKAGLDMTWPYIFSILITMIVLFGASALVRKVKRRSLKLGSLLDEIAPLFPAARESEVSESKQVAEDDIRLHLGQTE